MKILHTTSALLIAWSAAAHAITEPMANLEKQASARLCPLKKTSATCEFRFESVVQNRDIWAVAFGITPVGAKTLKETEEIRSALENMKIRPLEITREKTQAIAYYREKDGKFMPLAGEDFHRETLNPKSKIVVRYNPDFLRAGGRFHYAAPAIWETEGLSPATTLPFSISGKYPKDAWIALEILNLDDKPIPSLGFSSCRMANKACNAAAIPLSANTDFQVELELKAARKIKNENDQPAFKVALKITGEALPVVQLAIPFKPQPNYFLFGVVGFLFGGLIAAMMLFIRRRRESAPAN